MANELTPAQRQAVENRGGKLLVSAAAGSGKTKVLVDRLMGYILDTSDPADIDNFLIITYTKAAASELRGKIAAKLSELIALNPTNRHLQQQMQRLYLAKISTVHGFCTDILRQYAYMLDISADFRVADEGECLQLQIKALEQVLDSAYETAEENADFRAFVDSQGLGRDDRQVPEIVLKVYNSARCHLNPAGWLDWCTKNESASVTDAAQTPWGAYLLDDLRHYLSMQIDAIKRCIMAAETVDGMEKPVTLFQTTLAQLENLHKSQNWDDVVRNKEIDFGRLLFPKNCADLQLAEQMKAVRNACKEGLAKRLRSFTDCSSRILEDLDDCVCAARGLVGLVREFENAYDRLKRNRGILDFGDLEHKTLDLLLGKQRTNSTTVAYEIGERFREIMVDEYQDSNEIQDAIFRSLTEKNKNCFMVGDVKQSIYQFRLADPGIFIDKYLAYAPVTSAKAGEGRKVLLSHNFRSSAGVIEGVNDVFSCCMSPEVGGLVYGEEEMLREGVAHIPLEDAEVSLYGIDVQQDTYREEAAFVADEICRLLDGKHKVREKDTLRPIRPEDIVILLRSPGSVGAEFRYALQCRGIHCVTGDGTDLLQTEEIATVRSILQIINNPLQDIPLVSALTSPVFGYTAEDLAKLRSTDRSADIYTLLQQATDSKSVGFMKILHSLRTDARRMNVTELLAQVYNRTDLLSTFSAMQDGQLRLSNLQSFFQLVSDYESAGPKELSRFLEFLDAAQERGLSANAAQQSNAVTIMSIHKSKGLEFPVVFLCGLSRGFNLESARTQVLCHKDLGLGLGCVDTNLRMRYPTVAKRAISTRIVRDSISEELRVLYVAMTRARDRLIMTYAVRNLQGNLQELAMRLDMSCGTLLASEADCPGAWVLQAALRRTEAGAFFALGGKPQKTSVREIPWHIAVVEQEREGQQTFSEQQSTINQISKDVLERISEGLQFSYGYKNATKIPSKLTATQLKGRFLDSEIAEGTEQPKVPEFRKPGISDSQSGRIYGNAIHAALQYIRYASCTDLESICADVMRMKQEQLISAEYAELVDCKQLLTFFQTPIGQKLIHGKNVLREFKFSILDKAEKYYSDAAGEEILLQGVVDCAIIEDDGIIVIDFKTDYVTDETIAATAQKYSTQVQVYAQALTRIYELPVKSAKLYFFRPGQFVDVI